MGLSIPAGLRLQEAVSAVNPGWGDPLMVTLTYPGEWNPETDLNPTLWKTQLHNFRRALTIEYGGAFVGAIWRLEAQKRGAPHYHILIWHRGIDIEKFKKWTSYHWWKIVGSGAESHLKAGTRVDLISGDKATEKVIRYVSKYMGKKEQEFDLGVGRYWGVWNKSTLCLPPTIYTVEKPTYIKARRIIRKYRSTQMSGKKTKGGNTGKNQKGIPGLRCFISSKQVEKILDDIEPVPF